MASSSQTVSSEQRVSLWERPLSSVVVLNWETALYGLIFILAVVVVGRGTTQTGRLPNNWRQTSIITEPFQLSPLPLSALSCSQWLVSPASRRVQEILDAATSQ